MAGTSLSSGERSVTRIECICDDQRMCDNTQGAEELIKVYGTDSLYDTLYRPSGTSLDRTVVPMAILKELLT